MSSVKSSKNPDSAIPPGMTRSWYWMTCIWEFSLAWFGSRPYGKLALGMPAILLGCGVLGGVIAQPFYTTGRKIYHYRAAAIKAVEDEEIPVATMCLEKLWELEPANHGLLFDIATGLNSLEGADASTVEYLQRLAPEHEPGYARAHYWMAETLLNSPPERLREALPKVKLHLEHADAVAKRDAKGELLWCRYYDNAGDPKAAAERLAEAARIDPSLAYANMQVQMRSKGNSRPDKDTEEFSASLDNDIQKLAIAADNFLSKQIVSGEASCQQHLQQASVLRILNRPDRLVELSRTTMERFPDDATAETLLSGLLGQQFVALQEDENADPGVMVELVTQMLGMDRDATLKQLDSFAKDQQDSRLAKSFFQRLLNNHDADGQLSELLAGMAAQRDDLPAAERLYEVSLQKNPASAPVLNNLSWVLQRTQPDQLQRALELVSRSLELQPKEPVFRETRGQILVKLERWDAAVEDLKFALNSMPDSAEIHGALAKAYAGLGKEELARFHADAQARRLGGKE